MDWTTKGILEATGGRLLYEGSRTAFQGVAIDSRTIGSDQIFVAIRGDNHDGHTFIDQVTDNGITGLVIQADTKVALRHEHYRSRGVSCFEVSDTIHALGALAAYQRNQCDIPVVAITGSNGKTSTRQMTALVMSKRFNTLATQGNFNNEIGLPLTLFNLTTEHEAAVLELGMNHHGEITRLGAICRPTIGVITNVGPAHLEFLGSLEDVAQAKGELIPQVSAEGTIVLNQDDPYVAALAAKAEQQVFWYGMAAAPSVRAEYIIQTDQGIAFDLILPAGRASIALNTHGHFMVSNALAAASVGFLSGLSAAEIKDGLESFSPTKGRLQIIETVHGVRLIDDTYNANPASMRAAINTLYDLRRDRKGILILGDMLELGPQSEELHRAIGGFAAESGISRLYAHGTYAPMIQRGALAAGMPEHAIIIGTKEEIIADVTRHLEPGDWVLIKGSRGAAMETVVNAICHWSDAT